MNKWKISYFVLIGLLAALYAAVIYGVGILTATMAPIMHTLAPAITAFLIGVLALFVVKKIRRFGALLLFSGVGVAIFTLTGMGNLTCLLAVLVVGLIADLIVWKTGFKTLSIAVGHGLIQAAYFFGGCVPFLFYLERELMRWKDMGMSAEEIGHYVKYFTGWYVVLGVGAAVVCGMIGVYIGKAILKNHFKDMD